MRAPIVSEIVSALTEDLASACDRALDSLRKDLAEKNPVLLRDVERIFKALQTALAVPEPPAETPAIDILKGCLTEKGATVTVDGPNDAGNFVLDVVQADRHVVIQYRVGQGYGVSLLKADDGYGEKPDSAFVHVLDAAEWTVKLLETDLGQVEQKSSGYHFSTATSEYNGLVGVELRRVGCGQTEGDPKLVVRTTYGQQRTVHLPSLIRWLKKDPEMKKLMEE